jgi:hypothetical protein
MRRLLRLLQPPVPEQEQLPAWNYENMKDTPLGHPPNDALTQYIAMGYTAEDFYEHFPCFVGPKTLGRFHSLFECYQKTVGIAGHIAEVGVYRGAGSFYFAKLLTLYEPHATTLVHGFDIFERGAADPRGKGFSYFEHYNRVKRLAELQGLQRYVLFHQLDVVHELRGFFERTPHLRFKLVFLDAGMYDIVLTGLREFWPRLTPGGIVIFDQFNHEAAPEETRAVLEFLPAGTKIRTFPHGWMPTAYVIKQ